ncbi:tetratricopeptide repeat protein [Streptomyces sp. AJS327]|uniref:FxSxx-COOH system tetratricopeptide repeat protein n=1 Tax=Streptomyces sp. AJS327 TaxID=2545265 RepID=UPI0015DE88EC|nr:FxSxx-COOH system tetratricopeptide repeat protein [Streptomyces sp. AJS327]MBA0051547.1 tetratricopeptide repeat protein [Streptomyces sp. AJS327]
MGAQGEPRAAEEPGEHREDFTVVFPGYHRQWATWIYHTLDGLGHRVTLQRWDPPRERALEDELGDLLLAEGRVVLVLSDWFFQLGPRRDDEDWDRALRGFVAAYQDRFAAVNLTSRALLPATSVLRPAALWGVDAEEAERRLLNRLELPAGTRAARAAGGAPRYPDDPPEVWGDVPLRNTEFTGRDELLNTLQERLVSAGRGAAVCALVGMSGIGKTQVAAEYAYRFSSEYDVVWWINADERGTLRERYSELAPRLGLPAEAGGPGGRIRSLREALRRGEPYRRWLLIFDGWEDPEGAADLLPAGAGHTLITSRNHGWRERADCLAIPGFFRAESTGYLMRRAPRVTAREADEVATEFEDVPLALAQAAAWLGESDMGVADYLRMTRETGAPAAPLTSAPATSLIPAPATPPALSAAPSSAAPPSEYPQSSLTSWSILINQLRRSHPAAVDLLALCTAFAAGRIPLGLVRAVPEAELPEGLRWMVRDRAAWNQALEALTNFSVITQEPVERQRPGEPQAPEGSVRMHRLVHSIVSRLIATGDRDTHQRIVRRALAEADVDNPQDSREWPRYAELLAHLEASGALSSRNQRVRALVINCLRYCNFSGEYSTGVALAERVRGHWRGVLPEDDPLWLQLTLQQGDMLRNSGAFLPAYELHREQVDRLEGIGADESSMTYARSAVAADLRRLGRYVEGVRLQERTSEDAERLFGADDMMTLSARNNLGVVLRLLGRYQEAYTLDLRTLRRKEAVLRARHSSTLRSGNNCAFDLRLLGRYQEALSRQQQVLRLHLQTMGADHPQTLWTRRQLALCQYRAGADRGEIGAMLGALLDASRQVYGTHHHETLVIATDYANLLRASGELSHARDLTLEAEDGYRRLLGQAHPVPTGMQTNAGLLLQAEGDREGALNLLEQAYVGLRTLLGDDHPWTLGSALNASGGRNITGRLQDALALSEDTAERTARVLGDDHPLTLAAHTAHSADLRGTGEKQRGESVERDALRELTRTLGAQHPQTVAARQRVRPQWDFEADLG